jgi:hypothetical protein
MAAVPITVATVQPQRESPALAGEARNASYDSAMLRITQPTLRRCAPPWAGIVQLDRRWTNPPAP